MKNFLVGVIILAAFISSCAGGGMEINDTSQAVSKPAVSNSNKLETNCNIFIENSASMDGYVQGITEFEQSTYNLISDINIFPFIDSLNLFYINSDTHNFYHNADYNEISDFIEKLDPSTFQDRGGNRGTSDLQKIIKNITTTYEGINIIVSDFIFSPGPGADAQNYLVNQKIGFKTLFANQLVDRDISILFVKFNSKFQGTYYDHNNHNIRFYHTPINRPFYMMIVGTEAIMHKLYSSIDFEKYRQKDSLKNIWYFSNSKKSPKYISKAKIVLNNKIGEFDINDNLSIVNATKDEETPSGKFQFAVAVDYSGIIADEDYFSDPRNYSVPEGYALTVQKADTNALTTKGYTHLLLMSCNKLNNTKLKIALRDQLPAWVKESNCIDDTRIETDEELQKKTFGLLYLLEGIDDAYKIRLGNSNLFEATVTLRKAEEGSLGGLIWLLLIVLLGTSIFFIVKKIKSA